MFLRNLPDRVYQSEKLGVGVETDIDQVLKSFVELSSKEEAVLNSSLKASEKKDKRRSPTTEPPTHKINKIVTQLQQTHLKQKCTKCGGFGHKAKHCVNKHNVCHNCGSPDHFANNCHIVQVIYQLPSEQTTSTTNEPTPSDSSHTEDSTSDSDDDDCESSVSDSAYNKLFIHQVKAIPCKSTASSCSCRFGRHCLRLLLDSGASCHITGDPSLLTDMQRIETQTVQTASGEALTCSKKGVLRFMLENNVELEVYPVLYCPGIQSNILSVPELAKAYTVMFSDNGAGLSFKNHSVYSTRFEAGGYYLHATSNYTDKELVRVNAILNATKTATDIHRIFGHASHRYLTNAGLLDRKDKPHTCDVCAEYKFKRQPKNQVTLHHSSLLSQRPFDKIHADTVGKLPRALGKERYYVTLIDDYTQYLWVLPVIKKSSIASRCQDLIKYVSTQHDYQLRAFKTDHGSEFLTTSFKDYLKQEGIRLELSNIDFPSENGKVERANQLVQSTIRTILADSKLPVPLWPYAALYSVHIWNVLPRDTTAASPLELFTRAAPCYDRFLRFGTPGFARLTAAQETKFVRSFSCFFVGYADTTKSYLVFDASRRKVYILRDF